LLKLLTNPPLTHRQRTPIVPTRSRLEGLLMLGGVFTCNLLPRPLVLGTLGRYGFGDI